MILSSEYAHMLDDELEIIQQQTEGLTDQEALIQPPKGGNCMIWVLGHLADNLVTIQSILGGPLPADVPNLKRYQRGSEPILGEEPDLIPLSRLLETMGELNQAIQQQLSGMDETAFDEEIDLFGGQKQRRGWLAFFMFFHHSYHVGQLEFLRNLAGRTEKII
ncbi:MAG: DinB family protein [Anaerolineaceae bacterium]